MDKKALPKKMMMAEKPVTRVTNMEKSFFPL